VCSNLARAPESDDSRSRLRTARSRARSECAVVTRRRRRPGRVGAPDANARVSLRPRSGPRIGRTRVAESQSLASLVLIRSREWVRFACTSPRRSRRWSSSRGRDRDRSNRPIEIDRIDRSRSIESTDRDRSNRPIESIESTDRPIDRSNRPIESTDRIDRIDRPTDRPTDRSPSRPAVGRMGRVRRAGSARGGGRRWRARARWMFGS